MHKLSHLPAEARIWIYIASRAFNDVEQAMIAKVLNTFTAQWSSHGSALSAGYGIFQQQIIVFAVDEAVEVPSGCSIDKSVAIIRSMEQELGLSLLDRSRVFYMDGETLQSITLPHLKQAVQEGSISENTPVVDTTISRLSELDRLITPATNSWMKRYFTQTTHQV